MTERIQQLREQSLNAVYTISAERGLLMTEFYKNHVAFGDSIPVQRAKSFQYVLANKSICINDMELIVGERGPAPKATPTYPEITVHSLQDLEVLNSREKVWFRVDDNTRSAFEKTIIPFWNGRSNRDRMMEAMSTEWHDAYEAGIFTEFMEQRAPGHTVAGYKIYQKGMLDIIADVEESLKNLDFVTDPQAYDKKEELKAMKIAANTLIMFAERHAEKLEELATIERNAERKAELLNMAAICRRIPAHAPSTFHEVLQHYWFVHLGVVTELNPWDSFNPGRLDQLVRAGVGVCVHQIFGAQGGKAPEQLSLAGPQPPGLFQHPHGDARAHHARLTAADAWAALDAGKSVTKITRRPLQQLGLLRAGQARQGPFDFQQNIHDRSTMTKP